MNIRVLMLSVVLTFAAFQQASARPSKRSRATDWQLAVKFHDPQRFRVRLPGSAEATTYWYMIYEVTNKTGRDRQFYPSFRLVTDTLEVTTAGDNVLPNVYDSILSRHRAEFPFIARPTKVSGLLLQGKANARASVAVFRDFDPSASSFAIYASGFSGLIERLANPDFDPSQKESPTNRRDFTMKKTLAIRYDLPGDATSRNQATPIRRGREWTMR